MNILPSKDFSINEKNDFIQEVKRLYQFLPKTPDKITICFSNKMSVTAGNISIKRKVLINEEEIVKIKISNKYFKKFGFNRIIGTLRHEFAHLIDYYNTGKMGHGSSFVKICDSLGGTMNKKIGRETLNSTDQYIANPYKYQYECKCGCSFKTKRKKKSSKWFCKKCNTNVLDMKMYRLI